MVPVRVFPWEVWILSDTLIVRRHGDGLQSDLELQISGQWLCGDTN